MTSGPRPRPPEITQMPQGTSQMEQKAYSAIAAMFNSFPSQNEDTELRLKTMAAVLDGISSQAVCEAAKRFVSGEVKDQSMRFAPSVPEFVAEARRRQEFIDLRATPRIEAPNTDNRPYSPPVDPVKFQAWSDAIAGRRTWESFADEYGIKAAGE